MRHMTTEPGLHCEALGVTPQKLNIICWTMLVYDPPHHVSSHHNRDSILLGAADEVVTFGVIVGAITHIHHGTK